MKNRSLLKQNTTLYNVLILLNLFTFIDSIHAQSNKSDQIIIRPNSGGKIAIRSNKSDQIIIRPNSGGEYSAGAECDIIWVSTPEADSADSLITIEYSINNGNVWEIIDSGIRNTGDTLYYIWKIPTIENSSDSCKIRLKNEETDSVIDESDSLFTIIVKQQYINLRYPNQGNIYLKIGDTLPIQWGTSGSPKIENINIEMSIDKGKTWIVLASNLSNISPYTYSIYIPDIENDTIDGCLVRISDASDSNIADTTEVPFSIINRSIPIKNINYKSFLYSTPSIKTDIISQTLDIIFSMVKREHANIEIISLNGVCIHKINFGPIDKGTHSFKYNYEELTSGCFLIKINIGEKVFVKNIVHTR